MKIQTKIIAILLPLLLFSTLNIFAKDDMISQAQKIAANHPRMVFEPKSQQFSMRGSVLEMKFKVSKDYDFKTDEKLKEYMIQEGLRFFKKIENLGFVNLSTEFNKKKYVIELSKAPLKKYLDKMASISEKEYKQIWLNFSK